MADWIRVQYIGKAPMTVNLDTWYPNEIHEAPPGILAALEAEAGLELFRPVDAGVRAVAVEEPDADEGVTEVTGAKRRAKRA